MKQWHDLTCLAVESRQVRSLAEIASVAGQCQVAVVVGSAVLLRNDMLNVVSGATVVLMEQAVFASAVRPLTDKVPRSGIRHPAWFDSKLRRAFSLSMR